MIAPKVRRGVRLAFAPISIAAIIAALHFLGSGSLAAPPVSSLSTLRTWATIRDAPTIGLSVIRVLALIAAYHLVATTTVALLGRLLQWPGLAHLAERATLPPLRNTVRRAAGFALSASAIMSTPVIPGRTPSAAHAADVNPAPAKPQLMVIERIGPDGYRAPVEIERVDPSAAKASARPEIPPNTTLRFVKAQPSQPNERAQPGDHLATQKLEPLAGPQTTESTTTPRQVDPPAGNQARSPTASDTPSNYLVRAGDHLWAIAEQQLASHLGRRPSEADITPYWLAIVAANPQLVDPDLIFPGEPLLLPALTVDNEAL